MNCIKEKNKVKEEVYIIEEKMKVDVLKEYIIKFVTDNKIVALERDNFKKSEKEEIFSLDLNKIKFLVLPLKIRDYKEKTVIFKNKERFINAKIRVQDKEYNFDTSLCFVIFYSSENKISFLFEELIENILKKIDEYNKL